MYEHATKDKGPRITIEAEFISSDWKDQSAEMLEAGALLRISRPVFFFFFFLFFSLLF